MAHLCACTLWALPLETAGFGVIFLDFITSGDRLNKSLASLKLMFDFCGGLKSVTNEQTRKPAGSPRVQKEIMLKGSSAKCKSYIVTLFIFVSWVADFIFMPRMRRN